MVRPGRAQARRVCGAAGKHRPFRRRNQIERKTGCGQTLSSPNSERCLAKYPSVFRTSFRERVVGRDRRARRFRCKNVPDRPAVGPYHTMLEIPMKERKCSAGILSSRADNVWPHPCAGEGPLVVRPRRKKTQGRVFAPCARWAGCGMIPRITHTGKEVTKEFVDHEPDRHRRDPQTV